MNRRRTEGILTENTDTKNKPKVDSTLSKGLAIIEFLASRPKSIGVSELARQLGLTKSNTFRLLQTLTTLGYVQHSADKKYSATLKTWQIGREMVDQMNLRELCAIEMQNLANETGETIYLAVPEGLSVIYIDKIESQKSIRSWSPIGGSAPIQCVGTGKAILAAKYPLLREALKEHLTAHTDKSLTTIDDLDVDMMQTQKRGYACDRGEFRDSILSFGAAVLLPDGEPIAALGISVPEFNLPKAGDKLFGLMVSAAAKSVTEKIARSGLS